MSYIIKRKTIVDLNLQPSKIGKLEQLRRELGKAVIRQNASQITFRLVILRKQFDYPRTHMSVIAFKVSADPGKLV